MSVNRVQCELGHSRHAVQTINVHLGGQSSVREYPAIPEHLAFDFKLNVYTYYDYVTKQKGYCCGRDDVCHSLLVNKIWEGFETFACLKILEAGDPSSEEVLDFGAQLGWYTFLAAMNGYRVQAYDAIEENLEHLMASARLNKVDDLVTPVCTWLGPDTPVGTFLRDILLLKADVEGAEVDVVRYCHDLFENRRVHYALLEISPCFNSTYPDLLTRLFNQGYDIFQLPSKPDSEVKARFEYNWMDTLRREYQIDGADLDRWVASIYQENVLLVRR